MTGYEGSGFFLDPATDERLQAHAPPRGENEVLASYLDHYRRTFEMKCEDLAPAQLATRSVPPSTLSLLGLLRHLARVEQIWFRRVLEGRPDLPRLYSDDGDVPFAVPSGDTAATAACAEEAWTAWRREAAHGRDWLAACDDLGALVERDGEQLEVRDVLVHLVEEYARHCGHADLLRECLDGRTGQ